MKILAIRIKNLASLDGLTEIDFCSEPLSSAGIFAITGPTGAGKSTILDALCLALYAKTPRYRFAENGIDVKDVRDSTIKQDDVRGILRDGTADGYAEVDFLGVDGQHYRATWRVRRAHNKADGTLQGDEMALKNTSADQDIPGKKKELLAEIERLIGLNFEQFTRSVLLAQGDFTAFLKAGKDEKSSLLERLTGTNIYTEISKRIFEKHREQQQQWRELSVQREGIPTLTSEELNALETQKDELEKARKTQEQQLGNFNKEIVWHEQWATFKSNLASAETHREQARNVKAEAVPREQQLLKIERIQSVKPVINNLQNTQVQLAAKSKRLEDLIGRLTVLHEQKEAVDRTLGDAQSGLNSKIKELEIAQPMLDDAKALDFKLSEKAEQMKQVEVEVNSVVAKQNQHAVQLEKSNRELQLVEKNIADVDKWMAENESRRPIAEQEQLILSKLDDAKTKSERLQQYDYRIENANRKKESFRLAKAQSETEHTSGQSSLNLLQKKLIGLQKTFTEIPIQNLEEEKSAVDQSLEDIIKAEAHWKLLYNAIVDLETLTQSLARNRDDLQQKAEELSLAEKLLETKKLERDVSSKMLEKARLAAAENVERLRDGLEPEQPCPVCGSTTHPYANNNPQLDHVLAELEASHQQTDTDYSQQFKIHRELDQACILLQRTIQTQEPDISKKEKACQQLGETWTSFQVYDACEKQPVADRASWLQLQLQQQKGRQQQLREQIQAHGKQKEQLEASRSKLTELEKIQNEIANKIKDFERELKALQGQQANDSAEQRTADAELDELKEALSIHFPSEQWFQNWQIDPHAFTTRIRTFAAEWKSNMLKRDENLQKQSGLTATLKAMEEQSILLRNDFGQKQQKQIEAQAQWDELLKERQALFNGASVQDVEKALKQAIEKSKTVLEKIDQEAKKLQTELTGNTAQKEQLENDKVVLQGQEAALMDQVTKWLDTYNQQQQSTLTEAGLLPLLEFTQAWIETERAALGEIADALKHASSILTERSEALEAHNTQRLSERAFDDLTALKTEFQALLDQSTRAANEIGFKIKADKANKQRIGGLLQDIEKQSGVVDNWAKLNDIIGSADGKKFRQIAQEYTLDVLLSYANIHLEVLSKRYLLQRIPNSLGLQVLDQDMGDEVRTVFSYPAENPFWYHLPSP